LLPSLSVTTTVECSLMNFSASSIEEKTFSDAGSTVNLSLLSLFDQLVGGGE
jgi:hypothetical protein